MIDPTFLATLPEREWKCGLGEIVKYSALNGRIFDALSAHTFGENSFGFFTSLIGECVRHKARVVELDEKETWERKSLNVGHTTGHAIELACGCSHGESVLYGMLLETRMAISAGVCERVYGDKLLKIIQKALSLSPCKMPDFSRIEEIALLAKSDKKNLDDGNVVMSVAKSKGEWAIFSLPFQEYVSALKAVINE